MGGERVLWNAERPRDVAGRQTLGLVPDEQTEGLEPRRLRKRGQTGYIEINDGAMTFL
ncbi:MAG: hypothetical protein FD172_2059 [Methylocystaceae bacterium]|nr:MAG: hypothetical protein FD172_2059 [Methylocystaceae bacterium]